VPYAIAVPIPAGKADAVRRLFAECVGPRRDEYADLQRRSGISEESYWLQSDPTGDTLIVVSNRDQNAFMEIMANPQTPFDRWFRDEMQAIWDFDLNAPPSPPNALIGTRST
jgi:hypothetical protein